MSSIKSTLYQRCLDFINQRIQGIQEVMREAQLSADEETKSSAGDKYETGRSMLQLDMEQQSARLTEAFKTKNELEQLSQLTANDFVMPGSLVMTDQSNFYIAISAGKIETGGKVYLAVSPASPVGLKMMGLKKGESFELNGKSSHLLEIL